MLLKYVLGDTTFNQYVLQTYQLESWRPLVRVMTQLPEVSLGVPLMERSDTKGHPTTGIKPNI